MPPISVLIKPASSHCNLRCKYCFYHSLAEGRETGSYGIMKEDTTETIVSKVLDFADHYCTFAFQGGEPTLAGIDFFRKLVDMQKKHNKKNIQISNAIQTNGVVINEEWAKFLSENKFLVGISLDGPGDIHDANRFDVTGKGSFNKVMNGIGLLDKYKVEYNILCVVNSYTSRRINKIYSFFKKHNFRYLQFIPCLDPLDETPGANDFSLTPKRYTYFLKTLFDLWYEDVVQGNMISIRYFDNLLGMLMGQMPEACGMSGQCSSQFVIEADGGVYPCDFYAIDEWYLGNIKETGFGELKSSDRALKFEEDSIHVDPECHACRWADICRGGCRRSREPFIDGKPGINYYCDSYKEFFDYSYKRLQQLASMLMNR